MFFHFFRKEIMKNKIWYVQRNFLIFAFNQVVTA
jgi:hypothetical protein